MDFEGVRTFVAAAEQGQFQEAAAQLSVTQQAVSKRIAALEAELGARLFTRTPRGARLTADGQAFLPHARAILGAVERAAESVRPGSRALRVDVIGSRLATATLVRDFHRQHPDVELDLVTFLSLPHADAAVAAVHDGTIDATFRAQRLPARQLPPGVTSIRVLDAPVELLTGPSHDLAGAPWVTPADLAGQRIWIPGIVPGTEWAAYYAELSAAFGLSIDATGPSFGTEHLLDVLAGSPAFVTFIGAGTRVVWTQQQDLRRIPVRDPVPVYPHSLIWREDNPLPGLAALREHLGRTPPAPRGPGIWAPAWG